MKAARYHRYGAPSVVACEDAERPALGDDEVLIAVRAAGVNPLDCHSVRGTPFFIRLMLGLRRPKEVRLGMDVSGVVEAVGRTVTEFKAGDAVFGSCRGAFAEYACRRPSSLVKKPENVTFEQAASVAVAGLSALQGLRDSARLQSGETVLINGAAGGVGTFAVQIAKSLGADVTGVCSTRSVEMVRSIGADHVFDYTREDFTKSGKRYDVILDTVGNRSLSAIRRSLAPKGRYLIVGAQLDQWVRTMARVLSALMLSRFVSQDVRIVSARVKSADLATLRDLMASGQVTPVIDRRYPLSETAEAIRYVAAGHARGKVVIVIGQSSQMMPSRGAERA